MVYTQTKVMQKKEFEVIEAPKGFRVTDDIFWSRNFDRITRINEGLMNK
jgi:hypothetical protein